MYHPGNEQDVPGLCSLEINSIVTLLKQSTSTRVHSPILCSKYCFVCSFHNAQNTNEAGLNSSLQSSKQPNFDLRTPPPAT